jgi:hypothetical protein
MKFLLRLGLLLLGCLTLFCKKPISIRPSDPSVFTLPLLPYLRNCDFPSISIDDIQLGEQKSFTFRCPGSFSGRLEDWMELYKQESYYVQSFAGVTYTECGQIFAFGFWKWPVYGEISAAPADGFKCATAQQFWGRIQKSKLSDSYEPWRVSLEGGPPFPFPKTLPVNPSSR